MNTIKHKRKLTDLTQLQFAKKIGIPLRTYMRYEAEKNSKVPRTPSKIGCNNSGSTWYNR